MGILNFKLLKFFKYSSVYFIFFYFLTLNFIGVYAEPDCNNLNLGTADPKDLIICGSPASLNVTPTGRSLYEIIMLINNTLAILAVFLSIIGVIVGIINLAKSQAEKSAYAEAKGIITNSLLAFFLAAGLWLIVTLVLNSFGAGGLVPIVTPVTPTATP